jgi:hypothetical protein
MFVLVVMITEAVALADARFGHSYCTSHDQPGIAYSLGSQQRNPLFARGGCAVVTSASHTAAGRVPIPDHFSHRYASTTIVVR